jgi:hypothetical protein
MVPRLPIFGVGKDRNNAMPMMLQGSCRCEAVRFTVQSHTPCPYQLCYCSICRKTAGGGGFAINLGADAGTLEVKGRRTIGVYRAKIGEDDGGHCEVSTGERNFCKKCASALWLFDPTWPDLVHPFASIIDTALPVPPARTHLMLRYKASWVQPKIGKNDLAFDLYPKQSIEQWHKQRRLWIA